MADAIFADQIRAFTFKTFIEPRLAIGAEISVRAGDVHNAMGFTQKVPLVVASLRAKHFGQQYGLEVVRTDGVPVGSSTTLVFRSREPTHLQPKQRAAWAEVTSLEHGHGGLGWELGRWLWSPTTSKDGAGRYAIMQKPEAGDQVFHLVSGIPQSSPRQRFLFGISRVSERAVRTTSKPPLAGAWGDAEAYFRIRLESFEQLRLPIPMDDLEIELSDVILSDLAARPKYYPYAPYRDGFRGAQGIYLTQLSTSLAEAFRQAAVATGDQAEPAGAEVRNVVAEFAEGERALRESSFFKRNPALRRAAIAKYGTRCQGCLKSMAEMYGALGDGYIEIHHLNPLAERIDALEPEARLTSVDEVAPLCPNCHRMVHRRRPALSLQELRFAIETKVGRS